MIFSARTGPDARAIPTTENLRRLVLLRYIVGAVLLASIFAGELWLHVHAPLLPLLACVGVLLVVNLLTQFRLHLAWPVTRAEFLAHPVADIVLLGALLYFSGGSANPLVSLLLLPLIVAAVVLPPAQSWGVAALGVGCYTLLLFYNEPLVQHHHHGEGDPGDAINMHLFGMWLTFMLSAVLICLFLSRMAHSLRERELALARAREESLRNERIVALGTLAAGAAHELGTPLGNMLLLAGELERRHHGDSEALEDIADLKTQILTCKGILSDMVATAGGARAEGGDMQPADQFLAEILKKWELMRPATQLRYAWIGSRPAPAIVTEQTLSQAVINLLNNAADAAPELVEVEGRCADGELQIEIRDRGAGLTAEVQQRAGEAFFTTKAPGSGLGIGLFLANATIERARGSVRLLNRDGGGARTLVTLPLPIVSN